MSNLSISRAWDEAKHLLAEDGRLFGSVALALVGLPSMITGLISPQGVKIQDSGPLWIDILAFVFMLVTLAGQLALVRLALKPSITVGGAIQHGFQRMPVYLGAALLLALALLLLVIPIAFIADSAGIPLARGAENMTGSAALVILLIIALVFFFGVRMLMGTPVASAEHGGPLHIIKRSWNLTGGSWLKLFGFLLMIIIGAAVVLLVIGFATGAIVSLALGPIEPMSLSALVVAIFQGLFNAAFTALFSAMLARIYVQLSGHGTVEAPSKGT